MLNLTYPCRSQKSLLRNIRGPSYSASDPCSYAYRRSSALYYNGRSYGPRRASYSRKPCLRSTQNGLATSGKNYSGSPLRNGVCDIRGVFYRKNGLSYRKITYEGARRAWRRTCLAFSLCIVGRCYIQLLVVQRVPSRLTLYSQQAIGRRLDRVAEDTIEF